MGCAAGENPLTCVRGSDGDVVADGGPWVDAMKDTAGNRAKSRSPKGPQTGARQVADDVGRTAK